ncbi:hypothetical protein V8F33_003106 [Rhypophila sp. PSN 637]
MIAALLSWFACSFADFYQGFSRQRYLSSLPWSISLDTPHPRDSEIGHPDEDTTIYTMFLSQTPVGTKIMFLIQYS